MENNILSYYKPSNIQLARHDRHLLTERNGVFHIRQHFSEKTLQIEKSNTCHTHPMTEGNAFKPFETSVFHHARRVVSYIVIIFELLLHTYFFALFIPSGTSNIYTN